MRLTHIHESDDSVFHHTERFKQEMQNLKYYVQNYIDVKFKFYSHEYRDNDAIATILIDPQIIHHNQRNIPISATAHFVINNIPQLFTVSISNNHYSRNYTFWTYVISKLITYFLEKRAKENQPTELHDKDEWGEVEWSMEERISIDKLLEIINKSSSS